MSQSLIILERDKSNINCIIPHIFKKLEDNCNYCGTKDLVLQGITLSNNRLTMIIEREKIIIMGSLEDLSFIDKKIKQRCLNEL